MIYFRWLLFDVGIVDINIFTVFFVCFVDFVIVNWYNLLNFRGLILLNRVLLRGLCLVFPAFLSSLAHAHPDRRAEVDDKDDEENCDEDPTHNRPRLKVVDIACLAAKLGADDQNHELVE